MRIPAALRAARLEGRSWLLVALAAAVGLASSAVAIALRSGVHALFELLQPLRETRWGVLLPAAGAWVSVWLVLRVFREPGGHGVPAVLESVSRRGGAMRRRSIFSRLIGSLVNVASGGSAGLEGPIVYSTAAMGSTMAGALRLAERQRVLLLACGVAAGIGAIFNAPLTGMIFATEVVLAEWSLAAVIPVAVSAAVATEAGRLILGAEGAFRAAEFAWGTADLVAAGFLGAVCGLLSAALVGAIFSAERLGSRLARRGVLAGTGVLAAVAGLGVGLIGWLSPGAIGEGYAVVDQVLEGDAGAFPLLLALLAAKFLATTLTLGSSTPGGIFAPSLVLGAVLGSAFGAALATLLPGVGFAEPGFFALVAMAGMVAGTMQAPLTGIFLALETTRGWEHTLPLILVAVLSALTVRSFLRYSFYTWDLQRTGRLLRRGTDPRILAELTAGEMVDAESISVEAGSTLDDLTRLLPSTKRNHFAVVEPETGRLLGMLDVSSLRAFIFDERVRQATPVETVMDASVPSLEAGSSLLQAMEVFEESGAWVLPVTVDGAFLGTLSKSTLFDRYRRELIVQTAEGS